MGECPGFFHAVFHLWLLMVYFSERDNSGLNVTAAKRVFLLEPVVNHAFEVQGVSSSPLL